MQQAYVSSIERKTFTVLGKPLAPLTLGHMRLLYAVDSPFVRGWASGADSCTVGDLALAALICSFNSWRDAFDAINSPGAQYAAQKWGEKCTPSMCNKSSKTFLEYFDYYAAAPATTSESQDSEKRPEYVPFPYLCAAILKHYFHMSDADAWNTIVSDALAWNAARLHMEGHKCLLSDFDLHLLSHAKELNAQAQSEAANG